jgi:cyanophycinase
MLPVSAGPLALVGSGEYLPVMAGVEGLLLAGRAPRYVQIPTAAAPEGERSLRRWLDLGAAQAGCSAGAMALTGWVPRMRTLDREPDPGLGIVPHLRVLPHFDKMLGWVPDLLTRAVLRPPAGTTVLGIDEETAIVDMTGGGHSWQVHGRQQAWVLGDGPRRGFAAGSTLTTP